MHTKDPRLMRQSMTCAPWAADTPTAAFIRDTVGSAGRADQ